MSKSERVLEALMNGEELTAKQISYRFKVKNPRALVSSLRMQGYPVYLNSRTNGLGDTYQKYRIGTPTRAVIAAGYKALAAGVV